MNHILKFQESDIVLCQLLSIVTINRLPTLFGCPITLRLLVNSKKKSNLLKFIFTCNPFYFLSKIDRQGFPSESKNNQNSQLITAAIDK